MKNKAIFHLKKTKPQAKMIKQTSAHNFTSMTRVVYTLNIFLKSSEDYFCYKHDYFGLCAVYVSIRKRYLPSLTLSLLITGYYTVLKERS